MEQSKKKKKKSILCLSPQSSPLTEGRQQD